MNSFLIISCAAHAAIVAEQGRHIFHHSFPNWGDVIITSIICVTIAVVVITFLIKFYQWKEKKLKNASNKGEKEDPNAKQKAELQNKLLAFLEKSTSKGIYNEKKDDFINTSKEINSVESQYYISVLKALIEGGSIPDYTSSK